ncbi:hypothetical protein [Amycolatopsis sp. DSM 110486]|uniref:hypothetical protein n=1 Tax=Amycolatopsis sp. DSM 110486 TaxID=2865832 RepID=UPI001C69F807|nr:hypothetical protein [Amycolatopsis sp. DSM 110486]QYN18916.1 hypothetical protein K1T34_40495 [Amycolatopsis sp. DSM 110486]
MQWMLDQTSGIPLATLPCDRDPGWLKSWLYQLAQRTALTPTRAGDSTGYDDYPQYRVAAGQRLAPEDVSLRRANEATAVMGARRGLDTAGPLPPMQVSIPSPLDLAYICLGAPFPLMAHLGVFRQALVDDVEEIHQRFGDEVVFQIETPASLIALDQAPRALAPMVAAFLAGQIVRLITDTPREARWILHLCHGDLNHEPVVIPRDLSPAVRLVRAVHRRLTSLGEALPRVHVPMCTGTTGPPTEYGFYRALAWLPKDVEVIAGLIGEHHPGDSRRALDLAENALGRKVTAVAAACGHGRRSPAAAADNAALARELIAAPLRLFASHQKVEGDKR